MPETKTVTVTLTLPMNLELTVEEIDNGMDFDVKDVSVMPIQSVTVTDVNENIDDWTAEEIMRQIREA